MVALEDVLVGIWSDIACAGPPTATIQRRKDRTSRSSARLRASKTIVAGPDVSPPNLSKGDDSIPHFESQRLITPSTADPRQKAGLQRGAGSSRRKHRLEPPGSFPASVMMAHEQRRSFLADTSPTSIPNRLNDQYGNDHEPGILTLSHHAKAVARLELPPSSMPMASLSVTPTGRSKGAHLTSGPVVFSAARQPPSSDPCRATFGHISPC